MNNDPLTKPSRTNRQPKRRWKKPKNTNNTQRGLTDCYCLAMLLNAGNKSARAAIPKRHGANRRQSGFFMRKISALHIMSGWAGTRKSGRVVCPILQPVQSGAMLAILVSGLNPLTHEITQ
jgi:hypothetical protein